MTEQELPESTPPDLQVEQGGGLGAAHGSARSAFIEPDISAPVDVLEATTFFQAATSGGTN